MQPRKAILVVEDEQDLGELLRYNLEREGYVCHHVLDGRTALNEVQRYKPDLIVLDRMLPGTSGDDVISQLKRDTQTAHIPVIMLTAKVDESDQLVGFALGADDYVTKPFSTKLLLARVSAILRRAEENETASEVLTAGPITLDASRHELTVDGQSVSVTATEFRLLKALMAAHGRVLSRSQLIDTVLGPSVAVTDRTIDVHVTALRKKLGEGAAWIQTIRGVGYAFRQPS
jgi:two-component system phosphate regulon response regulator PhoB